jgi:hypothetical protein
MKFTTTLLFAVILSVATVTTISSCTKTGETSEILKLENLSSDKEFISLVLEMNDFAAKLSDRINKNGLRLDLVRNEFAKLKSEDLEYQLQTNRINQILKSDFSNEITLHNKVFNEKWGYVKKNYPSVSTEVLERECLEVLINAKSTNIQGNNIRNLSIDEIKANSCGWRFSLCAAGATAGAILCHAGCDTTALALTAGLGIPACVALCATLQIAAGVKCHDEYCDQ